MPELPSFLNIIGIPAICFCTHNGTLLKQNSSLLAYDVIITLFRKPFFTNITKLYYLPVRKGFTELCQMLYHPIVTCICTQLQSRRQNIVTNKHSHLIAVCCIYRRFATSFVAFVDHIIVDKRCSMQ